MMQSGRSDAIPPPGHRAGAERLSLCRLRSLVAVVGATASEGDLTTIALLSAIWPETMACPWLTAMLGRRTRRRPAIKWRARHSCRLPTVAGQAGHPAVVCLPG